MALSAAIGVHTSVSVRVCIGACVLACPFVNYRLIQSRLVDIILMIYAFEWQHHKMPESIALTHTPQTLDRVLNYGPESTFRSPKG